MRYDRNRYAVRRPLVHALVLFIAPTFADDDESPAPASSPV